MSNQPTLRKRILVIEDESVIRGLVQRVLKKERFDLVLAGSLGEGIDFMKETHFDLLLTDLRLPDGNGVEGIQFFNKKCPSAPVLIMTGSLTPEERLAQAGDLGNFQCLYKPFEVYLLQEAVARSLEVRS